MVRFCFKENSEIQWAYEIQKTPKNRMDLLQRQIQDWLWDQQGR